jgi:hypothetical protein
LVEARAMSGRRAPCTFRQTDVTRALRAARAAGFERVRIEIDREGKITIVAGGRDDTADEVLDASVLSERIAAMRGTAK